MCCGKPSRPVRSSQSAPKPLIIKPAIKVLKTVAAIKPQRENKRCNRCSYPTMSVIVAGRERQQCTNPNCRAIQK